MTTTKAEIRGQTLISYETRDLENIAATYPDEMREPFLWLADFTAEQCGRNLNTLEQKLKQLGLPTTAGTISKIMRGRWNRTAKNEKCPPAMALSGFIDMVEKLRANPDISETAELTRFIVTPTAQLLMDYIDQRRSPTRINKFGMIIGPTGAQKTATFKHHISLPGNNRNCKWTESPHRPKMSHFVTNLARVYNIPLLASLMRKMIRIQDNLTHRKCIIFDNVQRLFVDDSVNQEIFNFIQRLQEETGFTPIFSATPEFYGEFLRGARSGYFEQFEGRVGGRDQFLILPKYTPMEDILVIAASYGLQDAEAHIEYLTKVAKLPGRVRRLFQALQTAKEESVDVGSPLTIDLVKESLPESKVDEILSEAVV